MLLEHLFVAVLDVSQNIRLTPSGFRGATSHFQDFETEFHLSRLLKDCGFPQLLHTRYLILSDGTVTLQRVSAKQ